MNLFGIAYKSIRQRGLASSLTALSVALGVMLMVAVLVIYGIVDRVFSQQSIGYDLIVGPKGSGLDLVLSTVYRIRPPIENLPYKYYLKLKEHPLVEEAVPFALGDVTEQGAFPIVGTVSRYFQLPYVPGETFQIRTDGHGFRNSFDAIIGSRVAGENGWTVGSQFTLVHSGSEHVHDEKFSVVGVLRQTGTPERQDRLRTPQRFFTGSPVTTSHSKKQSRAGGNSTPAMSTKRKSPRCWRRPTNRNAMKNRKTTAITTT